MPWGPLVGWAALGWVARTGIGGLGRSRALHGAVGGEARRPQGAWAAHVLEGGSGQGRDQESSLVGGRVSREGGREPQGTGALPTPLSPGGAPERDVLGLGGVTQEGRGSMSGLGGWEQKGGRPAHCFAAPSSPTGLCSPCQPSPGVGTRDPVPRGLPAGQSPMAWNRGPRLWCLSHNLGAALAFLEALRSTGAGTSLWALSPDGIESWLKRGVGTNRGQATPDPRAGEGDGDSGGSGCGLLSPFPRRRPLSPPFSCELGWPCPLSGVRTGWHLEA